MKEHGQNENPCDVDHYDENRCDVGTFMMRTTVMGMVIVVYFL